jgi:hypothetical protein
VNAAPNIADWHPPCDLPSIDSPPIEGRMKSAILEYRVAARDIGMPKMADEIPRCQNPWEWHTFGCK